MHTDDNVIYFRQVHIGVSIIEPPIALLRHDVSARAGPRLPGKVIVWEA
jgi:hypothetical protein